MDRLDLGSGRTLNRTAWRVHLLSLRIQWFWRMTVACSLLTCWENVRAEDPPVPSKVPNFVFFLVDDLGWADLGCYGSTLHETPNIDALADSGMKFTQAYAACPVCSPTRASILTGRHPVRMDITDWIPGNNMATNRHSKFLHVDDRDEMPLEEVTIAEVLRENNFQNFFAGKWHLGGEGFLPTDQGFDFNIGGNDKGSPPGGYYAPWENPTLEAKRDDEYLTERLTEESLKFLDQRDSERPFLLYLSYYNVHSPITPYRKHIDYYRDKVAELAKHGTNDQSNEPIVERKGKSRARQDNAAYASMIAAVDDSVGAILAKLSTLGLEENTIVVFFSDNGGLSTLTNPGPTCNLPLRAGKGWLYEGGIREPLIVRAPGVTKEGAVCHTPVISMDFFPTILEFAGLESRPELHADGKSLMAELLGESRNPPRSFFWHYPHYHGSTWTPGAAVRVGDWKLIEFYEYDEVELYHLAEDIGEQRNLAESQPAKVEELRSELLRWQATMNARMPVLNPNYQPVQ